MISPGTGRADLQAAIEALPGEQALRHPLVLACVPSRELVEGHPRVFKDEHHPSLHRGGGPPTWRVATAPAAAPTAFPSSRVETHDAHSDGGMRANNPSLVGIAEAVKYCDRPPA